MNPIETKQAGERLRVCANCGAWVRIDRERCPWCGADGPVDDGIIYAETETHDHAAFATLLDAEATAGLDPVTRTVALPAQRRNVRWWFGVFVVAAAALALLLVGLSALGAYQGMHDRAVTQRQQAISYFEQGQAMIQSGRYELAAAAFEAALKYEPDWQAARQGLAMAEAAQRDGPSAIQVATATPSPDQAERMWAQAQEQLQAQEWAAAALTLENLQALSPSFQNEQVRSLIFESHKRAGIKARDGRDFESAVRHFDQALAAQPDDEVLQERQLAAAYRAGDEAWAHSDWSRAATEFRRVYLLDPTYFEVEQRLAAAHLRLGDAFEQRGIWCEAASHYRAVLLLAPNSQAQERLAATEGRCTQMQTATPAPESTAASATDEDAATTTPVPQGTPPAGQGSAYRVTPLGEPDEDFSAACQGHSIRGTIVDEAGNPIAGLTVVAIDEWGNRYNGESKEEPAGAYDLPISSAETSYSIFVASGGVAQSPTLTVRHDARFAQSAAACHIVNWRVTN